MKDKLTYANKYDSVDYQKIFKQNDPRFFIPILKQLGNDSWRFFLSNAATIKSVKHYYLSGAELDYTSYLIGVKKNEIKGSTLIKDDSRPSGIEFSCDKLIEESEQTCKEKDVTIYKGILYGSIETFECSKDMDCPDCNGSGKCSTCSGEGEIACPDCEGDGICQTCYGKRYVTCPECDGTGTIECENCNGTGKVDCYICNGSGECNDCHGIGGFANGYDWIQCKTCHGTGECNRCHGRGDFYCKECDGDGEFECHNCNSNNEVICWSCDGTGECSKCDGTGILVCSTCNGTGDCIYCNGDGKVVCSRCDGTGYYQTYLSYEIRENKKTYVYAPMINMGDYKKYVEGIVAYNDIFYKIDSGNVIIDKFEKVISYFDLNKKDFMKWISCIKLENPDMIKAMENKAIVSCIPVTEVIYQLGDDLYTFYILGTNNVIAYYKLPSKLTTLTKGIFNF